MLDFAEPAPPGHSAPVTVCLCPEDVVVRNIQGHEDNRLSVLVGVMESSATTSRRRSTPMERASTFATDLSINDVRDLGIAWGGTIEVALSPDRLRVFAQPPGTAQAAGRTSMATPALASTVAQGPPGLCVSGSAATTGSCVVRWRPSGSGWS